MKYSKFTKISIIVAVLISVLYIIAPQITEFNSYLLITRLERVVTMIVVGSAISLSTIIFQTVVDNRIITPSIIGIDNLFVLIQTTIVFFLGGTSIFIVNDYLNFFLSTIIMLVLSMLLFRWQFKNKHINIFTFLLIAIVFSSLIRSINSYMTLVIDPDEFMFIQDASFASFNLVNSNLIILCSIILIIGIIFVVKKHHALDVLFLGENQAQNLGIDFRKISYQIFILVAILISVSTALVGPMLFLGFITVNIAKEYERRHIGLMVLGSMISIIILVSTFWISQSMLSFSIPQSVIIDLVGGIYFLTIILKEQKQ